MFTRISVLVPTRGRVERLRKMLASFLRTTQGTVCAELVFRVDEDDVATQDLLAGLEHIVVIGPRLGGYTSMPVFFNEMAAAATGDVLMCGNDDMIFETPDWAHRILEVANQYPDGLFDIGVKTLNEAHYPFSVVSRVVVEALGFLWDPRIFWGDIYLRDVMAAFGRCVLLPSVSITHDWAGHRPDQVFMESDKNITQRDPSYWPVTHARAVEEAIGRLRALVKEGAAA